jgi:hypothetical protein
VREVRLNTSITSFVSTTKTSVSYSRVLFWSALGKIIDCIFDMTPLFFWKRSWMSLLDSRVNDKASTGELSGSLSKVSAGISAAFAKNKEKKFVSYDQVKKEEIKN